MTRAASGINLFEIADEAGTNVVVSNLTTTISEEAEKKISTVIYIDTAKGSLTTNNFTVNTSSASSAAKPVIGISIGATTPAKNISITNSNPGKIDISSDNTDDSIILDNINNSNPNQVINITTKYDVNDVYELIDKLADPSLERVRLTADFMYGVNGQVNLDKDIDLNNHTLTVTSTRDTEPFSVSNTSVTISNGSLNMKRNTTPEPNPTRIVIGDNGSLTLNNVDFSSNVSGIYVKGNSSELNVIDSSIVVDGVYPVQTVAALPTPTNLTINIENSVLESKLSSGVGMLFNIDGTLDIKNSQLSGGYIGLIARGGNVKISDNSKILSRGTETVKAGEEWQYLFSPEGFENLPDNLKGYDDWGEGTIVAYAALVIGNATKGSYVYPTTVELYDSTVSMTINEGNALAKDIFIASANNQDVTFITDDSSAIQTIIDYGEYSAWRGDTCYVQLEGGNKIHLVSDVTEP